MGSWVLVTAPLDPTSWRVPDTGPDCGTVRSIGDEPQGGIPLSAIRDLVYAFITTPSWADSQRLVERDPRLLGDEVFGYLDDACERAQQVGDQRAMLTLEEHRHLLRRCQQIGIADAFAELTGHWESLAPSGLEDTIRTARAASSSSGASREPDRLDAAIGVWECVFADPRFRSASPAFQDGVRDAAAQTLFRQHEISAEPRFLDRGIELLLAIRERLTDDSPKLRMHLDNLALCLMTRFEATGRRNDLDLAIDSLERALASGVDDVDRVVMRCNNLSNALRERYEAGSDRQDLTRALAAAERAVAWAPPVSADLPMFLNNLGNALKLRYELGGELADLDRAIVTCDRAVATTPADSAQLTSRLLTLGAAVRLRHYRTGDLVDFDNGLAILRGAVGAARPDSAQHVRALNALAPMLRERYLTDGDRSALDEAVHLAEAAVAHSERGTLDGTLARSLLGVALVDRYIEGRDDRDYQCGLSLLEDVARGLRAGSPSAGSVLTFLGYALAIRHQHVPEIDSVRRMIQIFERARDVIPANAPERASCLLNLGHSYRYLFGYTGAFEDLERSALNYVEACDRGAADQPLVGLLAAIVWGRWAGSRGSWQEATVSGRFGMASVRQLLAAQVNRRHKELWMRLVQLLPGEAAYAEAMVGNEQDAVALIEEGRGTLLAEELDRRRIDLERLTELGHGSLSERYRRAAERLGEAVGMHAPTGIGQLADETGSLPFLPGQLPSKGITSRPTSHFSLAVRGRSNR